MTRSVPSGVLVYQLDYPIRSFRQVAVTADGLFLVIPSVDGIKVSWTLMLKLAAVMKGLLSVESKLKGP